MRAAPQLTRARALLLLSQQIAVQRAETENRAGICFASVSRHHRGRMGGVGFSGRPGTQVLAPQGLPDGRDPARAPR